MTRVIIEHKPTNAASIYFISDGKIDGLLELQKFDNFDDEFRIHIYKGIDYGNHNDSTMVPIRIKLNDKAYLRHLNIEEIYRDYNPSKSVSNRIAIEYAFNEDYARYVDNIATRLSESDIAEDRNTAKKIADNVLEIAINLIENQKKIITKNFHKYSENPI